MPAYNFHQQFVRPILDKLKPHTIRRRRKRPTKVGDMLMLFTGQRTKQCRLFAISECVKIEPIDIHPDQRAMVNGEWLSYSQIRELSIADGFDDVTKFFLFFEDHYSLPTSDFEIVWWSTELLMAVHGNRKYGEVRLQLGGE